MLLASCLFAAAFSLQAPESLGFPQFSPDGKRLLMISIAKAGVTNYVANADGTGLEKIDLPEDTTGDARWGRDSSTILFAHGTAKVTKVAEMDLSSKATREIFTGANCQDFQWTPDGKRLLMAQGPFPEIKICTVDIPSLTIKNLTQSGFAYGCSISSDGSDVVFNFKAGPGPTKMAIYAVKIDGTGQRVLSDGTMSAERPVWSPDGKWIAYQASTRVDGKSDANVYVVSADGATTKKLTNHEGSLLDETPSWSPDGKTIAFQSNRSGNMAVYLMDADGTNVRPLIKT